MLRNCEHTEDTESQPLDASGIFNYFRVFSVFRGIYPGSRIFINMKDIDVVVLCGGKGTRLNEVVNDRPKPMAEINCHPFLDILIDFVCEFWF